MIPLFPSKRILRTVPWSAPSVLIALALGGYIHQHMAILTYNRNAFSRVHATQEDLTLGNIPALVGPTSSLKHHGIYLRPPSAPLPDGESLPSVVTG